MSSSPSIFSSDSGHQNGSDILGYASRTDPGASFLAGVNMSPVFTSQDFSRRPQDTGAMHSSGSMVRLLAMLRAKDLPDFSKQFGQSQIGSHFPPYDTSSQYFREECVRLRHEKEQLATLVHMLR
jgi:hypothetical protein